MVAHFTMRTYGVNPEFGFDEGIWLHRQSGQIRFFEQPSNIKTMYILFDMLYKSFFP